MSPVFWKIGTVGRRNLVWIWHFDLSWTIILCIYSTSKNLSLLLPLCSINQGTLTIWTTTLRVALSSLFVCVSPQCSTKPLNVLITVEKSDTRLRMNPLRCFGLLLKVIDSVCFTVCYSTSRDSCRLTNISGLFFNKTWSPSSFSREREGNWVWFQFIHPTNGPFTLLFIHFVTLFFNDRLSIVVCWQLPLLIVRSQFTVII